MDSHLLKNLILRRRTRKPALFEDSSPKQETIRGLIEIARHAPNHHRTEPARFYLLDSRRIEQIAKLYGEVVAGDGSDPQLVERGRKKSIEWAKVPGLLVVTCLTDRTSDLVRKKPAVIEENYATCCCICQNLLLLFEAEGIACKWSTGPVWEHPRFPDALGMENATHERVVALLFYGYSQQTPPDRSMLPLDQVLRTNEESAG